MFELPFETEADWWELGWEDLRDRSVIALILSNLMVIAWALYERWDILIIMWIYWSQSVIIGFFWFLRMLSHRNLYSKSLINPDGSATRLNISDRIGQGALFLLHYGTYHFGYAVFLTADLLKRRTEIFPVRMFIFLAGIFFANQLWSFVGGVRADRFTEANVRKFVLFPYIRVAPMHFTLIIGGFLTPRRAGGMWVLLFFLILKTLADVNAHVQQKKGFGEKYGIYGWARPVIKETSAGKVLKLPDGQAIPLSDHPELAEKIEWIQDLPPDVQLEACQRLLAKRVKAGEEPLKVACRCTQVNLIKGEEAEGYAEDHLTLVRSSADGTTLEYVCPETGRRWTMFDGVLTAGRIERH